MDDDKLAALACVAFFAALIIYIASHLNEKSERISSFKETPERFE